MKSTFTTKVKKQILSLFKAKKGKKERAFSKNILPGIVALLFVISFIPTFSVCEQKWVPDTIPGLWLMRSTTPRMELECHNVAIWNYMLKSSNS